MKKQNVIHSLYSSVTVRVCVVSVSFVLLVLISFSGIRQDSGGNTISEDVVAPGGGKLITDSGSNDVNAPLRRCVAAGE